MILLTGATGFLGKNFVFEHTKKLPIKILVRRTSDISIFKNNPFIYITYGNLTESESLDSAFDGVKVVIHCAARITGRNFTEFYRANVLATINLVQAMKRNKINKLLFISSQSAGGPGSPDKIVNEFDLAQPISFYGLSKKMAEDIVIKSELQYMILRPCSVYGPYDFEILKFIKLLKNRVYPFIGSDKKYVNLIYVKDLTRLMQKIVGESVFKQKIYYVSDGVCYQYDEIIREICRILNKSYCIKINIPASFAFIFGLLNDLFLSEKRRLIGFDKVREMSNDFWICQGTEIHKEIDWKPEYTLKMGMEQTIKWYKDNGYLKS